MIAMLKHWIDPAGFNLDGFRCDVASEVPTSFWEEARAELTKVKPDIIMLDDFPEPDLQKAVARNRARARPVKLEASGGVSVETVRRIAATGVDYVSIGALTKHLHAIDLSLRLQF